VQRERVSEAYELLICFKQQSHTSRSDYRACSSKHSCDNW